jgi:hypothetical protein
MLSNIYQQINKAVLAEVAIRQARAILREFELALNLKNIEEGTELKSIDLTSRKSSQSFKTELTSRRSYANLSHQSLTNAPSSC